MDDFISYKELFNNRIAFCLICHQNCAACCTVISISSPLPGMPEGKPAGERCVNLNEANTCLIHEHENYPSVCRNFKMNHDTCGDSAEYAIKHLAELEKLTS